MDVFLIVFVVFLKSKKFANVISSESSKERQRHVWSKLWKTEMTSFVYLSPNSPEECKLLVNSTLTQRHGFPEISFFIFFRSLFWRLTAATYIKHLRSQSYKFLEVAEKRRFPEISFFIFFRSLFWRLTAATYIKHLRSQSYKFLEVAVTLLFSFVFL